MFSIESIVEVLFSAGWGAKEAENVFSHQAGSPIKNRVWAGVQVKPADFVVAFLQA